MYLRLSRNSGVARSSAEMTAEQATMA